MFMVYPVKVTYRYGSLIIREVYIMARIANKTVNDNGVEFAFVNGETISATVDMLPDEIVKRLAVHGLSQKVGDSYASAETIEEAISSANAVINNLTNNVWATKSIRGGKIVEALVAFSKKPYDECLSVYTKMDDKAKKALRSHPSIKVELAKIEAKRAEAAAAAVEGQEGSDLSGLFA